ncbi:unnamed protein product [Caenorhabditis bovis]|uniref:Uncharacterized protein n=1 Tax=Caenorhabditis bovis TaxID=2654633 RepID=A0A8S1EBW1_9PELO|nr:unnamed protein product [Caenorhabditis bovis]
MHISNLKAHSHPSAETNLISPTSSSTKAINADVSGVVADRGRAGMAVFKRLKKSKDKGAALPEPEPVKQLDKRIGMDTYRDFFTLKNYWKAIDRKRQDSGQFMLSNNPKTDYPASFIINYRNPITTIRQI